jgi:hypothetical protein
VFLETALSTVPPQTPDRHGIGPEQAGLDGRPVSLLQALQGTPAGRELRSEVGWQVPYTAPQAPESALVPWVLREAGAGRLIQ